MDFPKEIEEKLVYVDAIAKLKSVMRQYEKKIVRVMYSGGSDSDTTMFLMRWCGYEPIGVFYDTGLEYDATWKQIEYMRSLGFRIDTVKAVTPIPTSNKKYGHPFISKFVSEMLNRLQTHNFDFQNDGNKTFEYLYQKYPRCKSALKWWTNSNNGKKNNIQNNKYLKEFLIENGLPFSVSNKCCEGAKKKPIKNYAKEYGMDLAILGIRKAEGGVRSSIYKNCFISQKKYSYDMFFPLFWWRNEDKKYFDEVMKIKHSNCYEEYGLMRTGCAGCPFGRNFENELNVIQKHEPKLSKGINNIFNKSFEWTRKYNEYKENKR